MYFIRKIYYFRLPVLESILNTPAFAKNSLSSSKEISSGRPFFIHLFIWYYRKSSIK